MNRLTQYLVIFVLGIVVIALLWVWLDGLFNTETDGNIMIGPSITVIVFGLWMLLKYFKQ